MSFSAIADFGYAVRFLRLLTMPVEKTGAFKQGVIDKNYKVIVPAKERTKIQKDNYTSSIHRHHPYTNPLQNQGAF